MYFLLLLLHNIYFKHNNIIQKVQSKQLFLGILHVEKIAFVDFIFNVCMKACKDIIYAHKVIIKETLHVNKM